MNTVPRYLPGQWVTYGSKGRDGYYFGQICGGHYVKINGKNTWRYFLHVTSDIDYTHATEEDIVGVFSVEKQQWEKINQK